MKMILKKLIISNFKGIKEKSIDFSKRTKVFGKNGAGKTTVNDAMCWLLFGKDSLGNSKFDVRPKDENGVDIDHIEISVTGVYEINGKEYTIEKVQKQKWVKAHGEEIATFKGNENKYTINTIPKSERDFKAWLNGIVSEDVFRYVSDLNAFMAQPMKNRREALFRLVSGITDVEVANSDDTFKSLVSDLQEFTVEEIMARAKNVLKNLNEKLKSIPPRIDEVNKSIVDIDVAELELQCSALEEQIADIEKLETDEENKMQEFNKVSDEIMTVKMEMSEVERKLNEEHVSSSRAHDKKVSDAKYEVDELERSIRQNKNSGEQAVIYKDGLVKKLDKLRDDYKAEKEREFDDSSLICPTCGQAYQQDKQDELMAKFEADRTQNMNTINLQGKKVNDSVKEYENSIDALEKQIAYDEDKLKQAKATLEEVLAEQVIAKPNLSDNQEYVELANKVKSLEEKRSSMTNSADYKNQLKIKRMGLQDELRAVQRKIDSADNTEKEKRIEELKAEQKQLSQQIADQERVVSLIEKFERKKVSLLTDEINKHFKVVKWRFYKEQVNGGYESVCDALVNGQSFYNGLNNGHKILAEIDILLALQEIYECSVPIFVDNAEALSKGTLETVDIDGQLILLEVSDGSLKVEV